MVAAEQDVGHRHAAKDAGAGVLRVLEFSSLAVRFFGEAFRITEHARHVTNYRIDHNHGRHLAAIADEVADGDFTGPQPQPDALIKAFIPAAQEQEPG